MKIHIHNQQTDVPILRYQVKNLIQEALAFKNCLCDELSIYFVTNAEISKLHSDYFNDPSTTDCISFPMDDPKQEGYCLLGDIFVCPQTAKDFAAANNGEVYEEISLYVIHGLLHLLGYDDIDVRDKTLMRQAEKQLMNHLKEKELVLAPRRKESKKRWR